MNREQLQKDFFPPEVILKIYQDIPLTQCKEKVKLVNDYAEQVRESFDEEVVKIRLNNQLAHIYWESEQYHQAISHFEIVVENMEPEDYPSIYFLALNQLIRCNQILTNYEAAEKWAELALENHHLAHTNNILHILNDYADVLWETETSLAKKYYPLIQSIIDEYGFPERLEDPLETIRSMSKRHKIWAKKMGDLTLAYAKSGTVDTFEDLEKYIESCEIEWYRNYARKMLVKLKSK